MIENHLLVPEVKDRWDCQQVSAELNKIFERCKENVDYCINGMPRETNTATGTPLEVIGELRVCAI